MSCPFLISLGQLSYRLRSLLSKDRRGPRDLAAGFADDDVVVNRARGYGGAGATLGPGGGNTTTTKAYGSNGNPNMLSTLSGAGTSTTGGGAAGAGGGGVEAQMGSKPVTTDQFEISARAITHKPTGATYTPLPDSPFAGTMAICRSEVIG